MITLRNVWLDRWGGGVKSYFHTTKAVLCAFRMSSWQIQELLGEIERLKLAVQPIIKRPASEKKVQFLLEPGTTNEPSEAGGQPSDSAAGEKPQSGGNSALYFGTATLSLESCVLRVCAVAARFCCAFDSVLLCFFGFAKALDGARTASGRRCLAGARGQLAVAFRGRTPSLSRRLGGKGGSFACRAAFEPSARVTERGGGG